MKACSSSLQTKGVRKTYLHQMMFPKLTPSTPQVWCLTKCHNTADWSGRCETPARKARLGRPRRRKPMRLADRPRKASTWSGNQRPNVQAIKNTP